MSYEEEDLDRSAPMMCMAMPESLSEPMALAAPMMQAAVTNVIVTLNMKVSPPFLLHSFNKLLLYFSLLDEPLVVVAFP
jgi:hypothetical protein